jgi:hypothetical protein
MTELRFVDREGKKRLQMRVSHISAWQDVPYVPASLEASLWLQERNFDEQVAIRASEPTGATSSTRNADVPG